MRDPKRIDRVLNLIKEIWEKNPDLRLCQLIENSLESHCLYYYEDDSLEDSLRKFYLSSKENTVYINFPQIKEKIANE